jgi:hypothetical protein
VEPPGNAPLCGQRLRTLWYRNGPHLVAVEWGPFGGPKELTISLDPINPSANTLVTQDMSETNPEITKYRAMLDFQTTTLRLRTTTVNQVDQVSQVVEFVCWLVGWLCSE